MDKKQIQNILNELYQMDGSLVDREKELISAIEKIAALKSEIVPDEQFKRDLYARLQSAINTKLPAPKGAGIFSGLTIMSKSIYALGGAALVLALVIGYNNFSAGLNVGSSSKVSIETSSSERAFGDLTQLAGQNGPVGGLGGGGGSATAMPGLGSSEIAISARPQSGGGGIGGSPEIDSKLIAPWPAITYSYVYKGEPFEITESKADVLKRITGDALAGQSQSLVSKLKFGGLNLKSFSNLYVQQLTVAEQRDYGYAVTFNSFDGNVSIYENWERWSGAYPVCNDENCSNIRQLTQADVPSDSQLISMADAFVTEHGIDISGYGTPEVSKTNWGPIAMVRESSQIYIPDVLQVVYPLLIDGKKVYDGAQFAGIYVNINLRVNKVSSVNNISVNRYEASAYDTEQDFNKILAVAKRGGQWGWTYDSGVESEQREIELGKPTLEYIRIWKYENNGQTELIVPALIFPVINPPQEPYYYVQNQIAVPIIKDLISQPIDNGVIKPLIAE